MKQLLKKYPVVITLTLVCLFFAIATSFYEGMYDLFAFHSKPVYIWQYFSGTFMHGSKGAPLWFLWVHLFMNYSDDTSFWLYIRGRNRLQEYLPGIHGRDAPVVGYLSSFAVRSR